MRMRFRVNLGSVDAAKLGLDYTKCSRDSEVDVSNEKAVAFLTERGIAEPVSKGGKRDELRAVPPESDIKAK